MSQTVDIQGTDLFDWQRRVYNDVHNLDKKYYWIASSRQIGKTVLLQNLILDFSINNEGSSIGVVSYTFKQVKKIFDTIENFLRETPLYKHSNSTTLEIKLNNGSVIQFSTSKGGNSLRGNTFTHLLLDELAFFDESLWTEVLQPQLIAKGQKCVGFSTPFGKNFFFHEWLKGNTEDGQHISYRFDYTANPYISNDEIEIIEKNTTRNSFRQEYLAEFISGGVVFEGFTKLLTVDNWEEPDPNKTYYAGIDLANKQDFTVLTILDQSGRVVFMYRDNNTYYESIVSKLSHYLNMYGPETYLEVNNIGDVIFEQLQKSYPRVKPFTTSKNSKQDLIQNLILTIEQERLALPTEKLFSPLKNEMEAYTFKFNPQSNTVQYGHPTGFHDDCVDSLALASKMMQERQKSGEYVIMSN